MVRSTGILGALALCCTACSGDDGGDVETEVTTPGPSGAGGDTGDDDGNLGGEGNDDDGMDGASEADDAGDADDADDAAEGDDTDGVEGDDDVGAETDDTDDDGASEGGAVDASAPPGVGPHGDAGASDGVADVGAPGPVDDEDATAEPVGDDAGMTPEPNFDPDEFELPEDESCEGVEFVDPEQACSDLGGLSLANPQLITDADGEWNPGEVARLEVELVAAPRAEDEPYVSPAIVAMFDVQSASFASVNWKTAKVFGLNPGQSLVHELDLRFSDDAPRGAVVKLHLEPATSDGNTVACDCPGVEVQGLTLDFEVQ